MNQTDMRLIGALGLAVFLCGLYLVLQGISDLLLAFAVLTLYLKQTLRRRA